MSRARELAKVTTSENLTFHSSNIGIGNTNPIQKLDVTGTVRATTFIKSDGTAVGGGGGGGGIGTALGTSGPLKDIYFNNSNLLIPVTTTIDSPESADGVCYTQFPDVEVAQDIIIADDDDFIIDILGITTFGMPGAGGGGGGGGGAGGGSSYADSNVDTHLNQSTAGINQLLSWNGSDYDWTSNITVGTVTASGTIQIGAATTVHTNGIDLGSGNITSHNIESTGTVTASGGITARKVLVEQVNNETVVNGEFNFYLDEGHLYYSNFSATGDYYPNFKINSSTDLNTYMNDYDTVTCTAFIGSNSTSINFLNTIHIDGYANSENSYSITTEWVGGAAPTVGAGSGYDVYNFTIIKRSNKNFHIFANFNTAD